MVRKKDIDKEIEKQLKEYEDLIESLKKKPSDYFEIRTLYFDEHGKFISPKKYRQLERQGVPVHKKNVFKLKVDLPEFELKAGDKVPEDIADEVLKKIREEIKYHNTIVGVMVRHNMTWEEAKKFVDTYLELYERGDISSRELHEIFSP